MPDIKLGDTVPDFEQDSTHGTIKFHEYLGDGWGILFSHPKDYTPVCTTELGAVARLQPEFEAMNTKVIALSVDSVQDHHGWVKDIEETQDVKVGYPILSDHDRKVADLYGMIHPNADNTFTVRSVFIIGPDKKLKLTLTYPASTGRNFDEIKRVLLSLQMTAKHRVATPSDWKPGQDVIIVPSVPKEEADKVFPGYKQVKPYLRYTPDPAKK
jgi:peroxiredoxin